MVSVLRVVTRLNIGGPARQALLLSDRLADRHPTRLVAGRPPEVEGELSDPAVPVTYVPLVREPNPSQDGRALLAVRRLLRDDRPVLVHTHMAKAGTIGRLAARSLPRRPRLVHTFHGHVLEGYFSPRVQQAVITAERALARTTDVLVSISPEIRDDLLALRIGRPEQHRIVPLGFDLDELLTVTRPSGAVRAAIGVDASTPLVGIVGRLVPIKDHATMLDVIAHLPDVHLAIVGDGELRGALEVEVRRRALGERVHFTGWWHDIPSLVSDLDVVVCTSRNEGTPVSLIEASAAARPVVSTDVGGVPSVVVDGVTGFLRPAGDASGLAGRVRMLLDDPSLARRLGAAGRDHVRARFGADRLVTDIGALYDELLDR